MPSILVVEDDEQVRTVISQLLERIGHAVTTADNGTRALELLSENTFDLMVTDIVMPDMEGLDLIQRARQANPGLRILAVSGGGVRLQSGLLLDSARMLGAHGTLVKPFTKTQLKHAVAAALS